MENDKAIAVSAAMVAVAAIASGAFVFANQTGASEPSVPAPPSAEIVVEYIDAQGNIIPIETMAEPVGDPPVAAAALTPVGGGEPGEHDEYDEEEEHEYEEDEYEEDEYEDEEHEDDEDEDEDDEDEYDDD